MGKPPRPIRAPSAYASPLEVLKSRFNDLLNLQQELEARHNQLDAQFERLHYQVQYVMELVQVRRSTASAILGPDDKPVIETGTLWSFWQKEAEGFIAKVRAEVHALQTSIDAAEAAERAGRADATAGNGGEPTGPTLANVEALAAARTKGSH